MKKTPSFQVAAVKVEHKGQKLTSEIFALLEEVMIEDEINMPTMFSLTFNLRDASKGNWFGIDMKQFQLGDKIKISLGLEAAKEVVTGEITALEPVFDDNSMLHVRGFDKLYRLKFGSKSRAFKKSKDSDIVKKIAMESGLTAKVDDTKTKYPVVFQNNVSDYDFLLRRAERIRFEMRADDKNLFFKVSQEDKATVTSLEFGTSLEKFSARLRTITEGSKVEVRAWDPKQKKLVKGEAKKGDEISKMKGQKIGHDVSKAFGASATTLYDEQVVDKSNAEQIAKGRFNVILKKFLSGEGRAAGNPEIRAG